MSQSHLPEDLMCLTPWLDRFGGRTKDEVDHLIEEQATELDLKEISDLAHSLLLDEQYGLTRILDLIKDLEDEGLAERVKSFVLAIMPVRG